MGEVTISSKFQIVIPKLLRNELQLEVGQKLQVIHYDDKIELIPVVKMAKKRGFLAGINTELDRSMDRY